MLSTAVQYDVLKQQLGSYHALTIDRIRSFVPKHGSSGNLYNMVLDYPTRGGKGFRPGLCFATCNAFGGDHSLAINTAASLELFHNAFLVHDDVEDDSIMRRGKPTMHNLHGLSIAVNVGDAMNVMSIRPLMKNLEELGPEMTWMVLTEIEHMVRQTVEGQALELRWVKDNRCKIEEQDYLKMILKKTCWYTTIHPMRLGALIAEGNIDNLEKFNQFGYYMGAAFQIQDDLLNLVGDEIKYGKETGGDILEGKRTLMLIHLLNHCTKKEYQELQEFLGNKRAEYDVGAIKWVMGLMEKYGCIEYGKKSSKQLAGAALNEYCRLFSAVPDHSDKEMIEHLVLYMVNRDY